MSNRIERGVATSRSNLVNTEMLFDTYTHTYIHVTSNDFWDFV